jgi:glycolate oxidase
MEKNCYMPLQYSPVDMATMLRVKDAFDPLHLSNPGKIFPTPGKCKEFSLNAAR